MKNFFVILSTAILLITFLCEASNPVLAVSCKWNGTQCVNNFGGTACTGSDGTLSGTCQGDATTCGCKDSTSAQPVLDAPAAVVPIAPATVQP